MSSFLIATRNAHKVHEIQGILGEPHRYLALSDFPGAPDIVEDAGTFAGNATKKAAELARWLSSQSARESLHPENSRPPHPTFSQREREAPEEVYVLADDSGLEVDALGGAPGVHSARFAALDTGAKGNSPTKENNAKLLRLLKDVPPQKRTARFHCVIALTPVLRSQPKDSSPVCYADEFEFQTRLFDGVCEGKIIAEPRGSGGFGYDPLFVPAGYDHTFGELPEEVKNRLSHRAKALAQLKQTLKAEIAK